jgi:hypothetical protein
VNQKSNNRTLVRRGLIVTALIGALALPTALFDLSSAHAAPLKKSSQASTADIKSRVNAARSKSVAAKRAAVSKKAASVRSARAKSVSAKRAAVAKKATTVRSARAKSVAGKKVSVAKKAIGAKKGMAAKKKSSTTPRARRSMIAKKAAFTGAGSGAVAGAVNADHYVASKGARTRKVASATPIDASPISTGTAAASTAPISKSRKSKKSAESSAAVATPFQEATSSGFVPTTEKVAPATVVEPQGAMDANSAKKGAAVKKVAVGKKGAHKGTRKSTKGKRAIKKVRAGL